MIQPDVRQARLADLELLPAELGDAEFFADRFDRQRNGRGVLLLAWLAGRPVGVVYLWLERAEERPIRRHLPGVPLLTHLEVLPEFRNRGLGSLLIEAVERTVRDQGKHSVALAVRTDNAAAARLYRRLDYADWGRGKVVCHAEKRLAEDIIELEPEDCHVMVKSLGAPQLVTALHQAEFGQDLLELGADRTAGSFQPV